MKRRRLVPLFGSILLLALLPMAAEPGVSQGPPAWFLQHLRSTMQQGGRTIADNAAYQSATEPFDAYGLEWFWGIGKCSARGRLFALKDGVEVGDLWELRSVWHPGDGEVRVYQFGSDGSLAEGWMRPLEEGGVEIEQTLFAADGSTSRVRHESHPLEGGGHADRSFNLEDGAWKPRRSYTWSPVPPEESGGG